MTFGGPAIAMTGLLLAAWPAFAQQSPAVFGQAGVVLANHPAGLVSHRTSPALEGWTPGASVAVGVHLSPRWSVQADATVERALSAPQQFHYSWVTDYTAQSRDVLLGAALRWRSPTRTAVELAAGGGVAFSTFRQVDSVTTYPFSGGRTERNPDREESVRAPTAHASLAMAVPVSGVVEIVPAFSVRWTRRSAETLAYELGAGRVAVLTSLSLRFGTVPERR